LIAKLSFTDPLVGDGGEGLRSLTKGLDILIRSGLPNPLTFDFLNMVVLLLPLFAVFFANLIALTALEANPPFDSFEFESSN